MSALKTPFLKTICRLLAALLAAGALYGCTPASVAASSSPPFSAPSALPAVGLQGGKLLCTLPNLQNDRLVLLARAVQDRCDALGVEVILHDAAGDMVQQAAAIESFVSAGGSAIICDAVHAGHLASYIESAKAAGIPVIGTGPELPGAAANVPYSPFDAGLALARHAVGLLGVEGENGAAAAESVVCILEYENTAESANAAAGIESGFTTVPDSPYRVVRLPVANIAQAEAAVKVLAQREEGLCAVLATDDTLALAAMAVLAPAAGENGVSSLSGADGEAALSLLFGGVGGTEAAKDAIRSGAFYLSLDSGAPATGAALVEMAMQAAGGENPALYPITLTVLDSDNINLYGS